MEVIRVLHIVRDDKFIDGTLRCFEKDARFENKAVMIVDSPDYKFRLVRNIEKIKLLYNKQMLKEALGDDDYDVIFIYSLPDYHVFKFIPNNKTVIWWAWGYDIYGAKRFINIPLYKPQTEEYYKELNLSIISRIKNFIKMLPFVSELRLGSREKAIKRIDYFQPVIHTEYELMKRVPGFRAKEFYYPRPHISETWLEREIPVHGDNLIINHSATLTANHLDVWSSVKDFIPNTTTVYFPINYGIPQYAEYLQKAIISENINIKFIKDFMPRADYFKIVDSCSYAVFGVLREAAMSNIYHCLAMGVKVFLYKDSLLYQYLTEIGYVIYAIEDINKDSFRNPLTREQIDINRKCILKERAYKEKVTEKAIFEIMNSISLKS